MQVSACQPVSAPNRKRKVADKLVPAPNRKRKATDKLCGCFLIRGV